MKVYSEILKKFVPDLPNTEVLKNSITQHAFEVEEVITCPGGDVLDLKVLPDRAHDCLSHRGIAREIATHTGKIFTEVESNHLQPTEQVKAVEVKIESPLCSRYIALRIENIQVSQSPDWLKESLVTLDQKSINTLVDLTNYVMFELGQPMHVFDADKIKGQITIRLARLGEKMVTLDNKEISLTDEMLVIADDEGVLALAGIKGGKKAEVDSNTKSIILECGNFDSVSVRRTAFKTGVRTDASKRFENNYPAAWAERAVLRYVYLLQKEQLNIQHGQVTDIYPNPSQKFITTLSLAQTNKWLGTSLTQAELVSIIKRLHLECKEITADVCEVVCDDNLFNIRTLDDQKYVPYQIIGHVGRVIGFHQGIKEKEYKPFKERGLVAPYIAETDRIRNELIGRGFVEVRTYHFQDEGEEELENPLASDKKYIRSTLEIGMTESLNKAIYNAPLLGRTDISIFEIGTVVTKKDGERIHLALAAFKQNQKKQKVIDSLKQTVSEVLPMVEVLLETENYLEVAISDHGKLVHASEEIVTLVSKPNENIWQPPSKYPHAVRDISFFTSPNVEEIDKTAFKDALEQVASSVAYTGPNGFVESHCFRVDMIDEFEKVENGLKKFSRTYRFVFQASDHTLTEDTIKRRMFYIEKYLRELGCQIR